MIKKIVIEMDITAILSLAITYGTKLIAPENDPYPKLSKDNYDMLFELLPKEQQDYCTNMLDTIKNNPEALSQMIKG